MAKPLEPLAAPQEIAPPSADPLLEPGDRLSRAEFERRYDRMPALKKAELIEGVVYMPSPVRLAKHAIPHGRSASRCTERSRSEGRFESPHPMP